MSSIYDLSKTDGIPTDNGYEPVENPPELLSKTEAESLYRRKDQSVPGGDINGLVPDTSIHTGIARNSELASAISDHEALIDPHDQYVTPSELPYQGSISTALALTEDPETARAVLNAASPEYIQSRLLQLITNGSGLLGDDTNFSEIGFDSVETYGGGGSISHLGGYKFAYSDEFIPIDVDKYYRLSAYVKAGNSDGSNFYTNKQYFGLVCFDADKNDIRPFHFMIFPGSTKTYLAEDLNPNDTEIKLVNGTGWNNAGEGYQRNIMWYGYTNGKGYTYPDFTYTRNTSYLSSTLGAWNAGGISGNTITLRVPWQFGFVPAGTAVANGNSGGQFKYITLSASNVPNSWTYYSGLIGTTDTANVNAQRKFPYGAVYTKLLFLLNYPTTSSGNRIRFSNISFTDSIPESMPSGDFLNRMNFKGGLQVNGNGILEAINRGVNSNVSGSSSETITVTGVLNNGKEVVEVTRGKNAYVSDSNEITFDATGISGTVYAYVKRYN